MKKHPHDSCGFYPDPTGMITSISTQGIGDKKPIHVGPKSNDTLILGPAGFDSGPGI